MLKYFLEIIKKSAKGMDTGSAARCVSVILGQDYTKNQLTAEAKALGIGVTNSKVKLDKEAVWSAYRETVLERYEQQMGKSREISR